MNTGLKMKNAQDERGVNEVIPRALVLLRRGEQQVRAAQHERMKSRPSSVPSLYTDRDSSNMIFRLSSMAALAFIQRSAPPSAQSSARRHRPASISRTGRAFYHVHQPPAAQIHQAHLRAARRDHAPRRVGEEHAQPQRAAASSPASCVSRKKYSASGHTMLGPKALPIHG